MIADFPRDPYPLQEITTAIRTNDLPAIQRLIPPDSPWKEAVCGRRRVTAINLAAIEGKLEILKYLVEIRCNLDHVDEDGFTCGHLAAWYNHTHIIEYLGQVRPGQLRSTQFGNLPIHIAAYRQMYESLIVLARYSDINQQDKHLNTALRIFIQRSDVQGVKACIAARARVRNIDINTVPTELTERRTGKSEANREILRLLTREKNWYSRRYFLLLLTTGALETGTGVGRLPTALYVELVYYL